MKENVKIDSILLGKVRKTSEKMGQTIGGFVESSVKHILNKDYLVVDNSDAFHKYLDSKGIKYKSVEHGTVLLGIADPITVGMEWGIYKYQHSPYYKDIRDKINNINQ